MEPDKNRIRIFKKAHQHVFNCLMSTQYSKAAEINNKLTAILKWWAQEKVRGGKLKTKRSRNK